MAKTLSCGVLLFNERNEILLCHVTGASWWDIPKGGQDEGESVLETAVRETFEEAGIVLNPELLTDLGYFSYRPEKALHLFAGKVTSAELNLEACTCTSYFEQAHTGAQLPEVDQFAWVPIALISDYCAKTMANLLGQRLALAELIANLPSQSCLG